MRIVKYSAKWCSPCRQFRPVVEKVSEELGIDVVEIDIDEQPTEGVMSIPTVRLVDDNNNVVAEHIGVMSIPKFRQWVQENSGK